MSTKKNQKPAVKSNAKKAAAKPTVKPVAKRTATAKVAPAPRAEKVAAGTAPAVTSGAKRDPRLPAPGTILTGKYKGREYKAKVLENGFLYDGRQYKSLSAIGKDITKAATNGFAFFRLIPKKA